MECTLTGALTRTQEKKNGVVLYIQLSRFNAGLRVTYVILCGSFVLHLFFKYKSIIILIFSLSTLFFIKS